MSKMRSDRKPPLAAAGSPMRLRPRRVLRSTPCTVQTPPGSLTKTQLPIRSWDLEEPELRPEYRTISCELQALAKMVQSEFGNPSLGIAGFADPVSTPLFERGRFYDEYSARRNERLKRKKGDTGDEKKSSVYDLGVKVGSVAKRRDSKRFEGLRQSVPSTPVTERSENPRYLLRSSTRKENQKPPLPVNAEKSVGVGDRKIGARRVLRK
ncbi:uncharacterized protein LOC132278616 [Cornus florida]|uniref:uncharacterized protein LOC132278616 n=1 Tax=Cornus florida TaxID=4283 RepID=UPI00289680A8|nr:uncharacterized protein LOC132278616 [Cornus florida]XP_059636432.1 uncharacterized protein LOC132278616 [Cornus florida]